MVGQFALAASISVLLVMVAVIIIRAIRQRRRPQYSLARLLAMTVAAGVGLLGGLHWHFSAKGFAEATAEHQKALARFKRAENSEKPAHEVTLTKPFYMGKFEVTQEQYQQVIGSNPSAFKGRDLPVEQVLWIGAQKFCEKASEKTGLVVRLPTEAEWEHACRAGTRTTYYTGDAEADLDRAGWDIKSSKGPTHPVGQKTPNAWGLYDMHGNLWEWCADWSGRYKAEAAVDPHGPPTGIHHILRGGSVFSYPSDCRSASRYLGPLDVIGFRVAAVVPSKAR